VISKWGEKEGGERGVGLPEPGGGGLGEGKKGE